MRTTRLAIIAASSWVIIDAILWLAHFADIQTIDENVGPDSAQAFMIVVHWPGLMIAQLLPHFGSTAHLVIAFLTELKRF